MARRTSSSRGPSRTAVFVCQGRAVAHGRIGVGRFDDPVAERLLTGDEVSLVAQARSGEQPTDWRRRMEVESLRACAEVVAPRTVAIDDEVRRAAHGQVVILGAGLDTRPWRMAELAGCVVFAVDHPASQADARARSAALEPMARELVLVPADLAVEDLAEALSRAGHDQSAPTTWVWEGVVPYLTAEAVAATGDAIARCSAADSMLVVSYQTRSLAAQGGRLLSAWLSRTAHVPTPTGGEPWRSLWSPEAMRSLLERVGFAVVRDEALRTLARSWQMPTEHRRSLANGRVLTALRRPAA